MTIVARSQAVLPVNAESSNDLLISEFARYLGKTQKRSPHTVINYCRDVKSLAGVLSDEFGEDARLATMSADELNVCLGIFRNNLGYKTNTVARKVCALKAFFKWFAEHRDDGVETGPVGFLSALRAKRHRETISRFLTLSHVTKLMRFGVNTGIVCRARDTLAIRLFLFTGISCRELVAINLGDFTLERDAITRRVVKIVSVRVGQAHTISLDRPEIQEALVGYLNLVYPKFLGQPSVGSSHSSLRSLPLMVSGKNSKVRIKGRSIRRNLQKIGRKLGISQSGVELGPTSLRHRFVIDRLKDRTPRAAISQLLGKRHAHCIWWLNRLAADIVNAGALQDSYGEGEVAKPQNHPKQVK